MTLFNDAQMKWMPLRSGEGFEVSLRRDHPYFSHHRVRGWRVLPGVVYLELALSALLKSYPSSVPSKLIDAVWLHPILGEEDTTTILVTLKPDSSNKIEYQIYHNSECCGYGVLTFDTTFCEQAVPAATATIISSPDANRMTGDEIYKSFSELRIDYGPTFQRISHVTRLNNSAVARLSAGANTPFVWANLLDCSFQAGMAISLGEHQNSLMPYSLGQLVFHQALPVELSGGVTVLTKKLSPFRTNITIIGELYGPLISVFDLGVKPSQLQ